MKLWVVVKCGWGWLDGGWVWMCRASGGGEGLIEMGFEMVVQLGIV